jgi:hypothetical protein
MRVSLPDGGGSRTRLFPQEEVEAGSRGNRQPGDDDVTSSGVSWSYTGFNMFREWLAQAEGFSLAGMHGFGGDRPWSSVSTTPAPLLDHPDDDGPDLVAVLTFCLDKDVELVFG